MTNKYDHFIWFDTNINSTSGAINDIVNHLETEIRATGKIRRWYERYSEHIQIIVLNLCQVASIDLTRYVAYSRNKNDYNNLLESRYHAFTPLHGSMIKMVDIMMDDLGYIEGVKGFNDRRTNISRTSKMIATDKLFDLVNRYNLSPHHITRNPAEEVIILKTRDEVTKKKKEMDYDDTHDTIAMRNNLNIINNEIKNHFIGINVCDETLTDINKAILGLKVNDCAEYDDYDDYEDLEDEVADEEQRSWKSENDKYRPYLDLSKIKLKRIFNNNSFEQGGRFYSVWWQAIPGKYRPYIAIDDQQTIEVDFSGIHINLLYLQEELPLPTDDVYTIEGFPTESRKVLKVALQILLNSKNEARALRSIKNKFPVEDYPELFNGVTHEQIIEAFKEKHVGIVKHFYMGVGVKLQFMDSQIAEDILLELSGKGIAALPIHDSFIVRKDYVDILKDTMKEVVRKRFGQALQLKEDKTAFDLAMEILIRELPPEDLPLSSEEYDREFLSKHRHEYLSRRDHWYSERNS